MMRFRILTSLVTSLAFLIILTTYLIGIGYAKVFKISYLVIPYGYSYTVIISLFLIITYTVLTILSRSEVKKFKSIESQITDFIFSVSTYIKSGTTLYESISLTLPNLKGYFRNVIEKFLNIIALGNSLDEAIRIIKNDLGEEFTYILKILSIAEESGGKAVDVLDRASTILSNISSYRNYRRRVLRQYLILLLIVIIVYDFAVMFLLLIMNSLNITVATFIAKPNVELMYTLLYYTSVVIALVSGLAYGKCVEGSITRSFSYVLTLSALNFIVIHTLLSIVVPNTLQLFISS
jgi:hypothetical protein